MESSKSEFLVKRENLFVRRSPQDITTVNTSRENTLIRTTQLSPLTSVKTQRYARPNPGATTSDDDMRESQNNTEKLKISPMERMTRAVGAGLRGLCKGKAEEAKQRDTSRRLSRVRLHDEVRLGTAAMISVTPMRAPQPTHHLPRAPPSLRPTPSHSESPSRRTTRAMMENYD